MLQFIVNPKRGFVMFFFWLLSQVAFSTLAYIVIGEFTAYLALYVIPNAVFLVLVLLSKDMKFAQEKQALVDGLVSMGMTPEVAKYVALYFDESKIISTREFWS